MTSWSRLGAILGRFGTLFESKNHQNSLENVGSRENSDFLQNKATRDRLGPILARLEPLWGAILAPKTALLATQSATKNEEQKRDPKRAKKSSKINIS